MSQQGMRAYRDSRGNLWIPLRFNATTGIRGIYFSDFPIWVAGFRQAWRRHRDPRDSLLGFKGHGTGK